MKRHFGLVGVSITLSLLLSACTGMGKHANGSESDTNIQNYEGYKILDLKKQKLEVINEDQAIHTIQEVSSTIGLDNGANEIEPYISDEIDGDTYYRLTQFYKGIPVFGRYFIMTVNDDKICTSLSTDVEDFPDDISVEISVSEDAIKEQIIEYARKNWGFVGSNFMVSPVNEDKLVWFTLNGYDEICLAYRLEVYTGESAYLVLVDVKDGNVLYEKALMNTIYETGTTVSGELSFPVVIDDNKYFMCDPDKKIEVYNSNGKSSSDADYFNNLEKIISDDQIFGNSEMEENLQYDYAAKSYCMIRNIADYYEHDFSQKIPFGKMIVTVDDQYDNGNNGRGGSDDTDGIQKSAIALGRNFSLDSYTVLGHEYFHTIQHEHDSSTAADKGISEGLADIFGILIDAEINKTEPLWDIDLTSLGGGHRNAKDPAKYGYPVKIDEPRRKEDDAHYYATVYSHMAYLMYDSGLFNLKDIEKIWFRTMLRLPALCSGGQVKTCIETEIVNYYGNGSEQVEFVRRMFKNAHTGSASVSSCMNDFSLVVYDKFGNPYDDYSIKISGKTNGFLGFNKDEINENYIVGSENPYQLHLENGEYGLTITDNATGKNYYLRVNVDKKNNDTEILYPTDFGADYCVKPGAKMIILDKNGNVFNEATITASQYESNSETELIDGHISLNEHNYYMIFLSYQVEKDTYYEHFTLRVKDSGEDKLEYTSSFGYFSKEELQQRFINEFGENRLGKF